MPYEQFKKAISKGQATKAPTSPYADIQGLFNSQFQLGAAAAPVAGLTNAAAVDDANARAAASAASAKKAAELKEKLAAVEQKMSDYQNPSKWQQVPKEDGGYDYIDPLGNKTSIAKYAEVTGKNLPDILRDSRNSLDQQFVSEYDLLKKYTDTAYKGNLEEVQKLVLENPTLAAISPNVHKPEDVWRSFIEYYPNYFDPENINATPRGNIRIY